mgnify:CR=1 FL=1
MGLDEKTSERLVAVKNDEPLLIFVRRFIRVAKKWSIKKKKSFVLTRISNPFSLIDYRAHFIT